MYSQSFNLSVVALAAFLFVPVSGCSAESERSQTGLDLPPGFSATVFADDLGTARHITVADNGDTYVMLRQLKDGRGIAALRDEDHDGRADRVEYFGSFSGTGIQLYNGYLYASSDTAVYRFAMSEGRLVPETEPETVISGFPKQGSHAVKPFTFDGEGHIYVNVGAPSNACQKRSRTEGSPGQRPCPQREWQAGIWRFNANATDQTQQRDGVRYATGIRNSVALDWDKASDSLYVVQHGRDQLNTLWPKHFDSEENAELPAEEFFRVNRGDDFGWPYAYYDHRKKKKMLMPEYGGNGEELAIGDYEEPILAFPGHWAPNDLLFYTGDLFPQHYRSGAFIAFHGSWNRAPEPQEGYKVVFVPFKNGEPTGDFEEFATGFPRTDNIQPGNARYRPTGLAQGPDGSLYITESKQGRVWRVTYNR